MGRHHTNPPNPAPNPPNGEHRHKGGGPGTTSPRHQKRGQQGGGDGQPDTPHPPGPRTRAEQRQQRGGTKKPQPLYEPRPTHPPPNPPHGGPTKGGGRTTQTCGGHSTGETPSNIPNLEAKPGRANGTAPQGVRESRKPPQHTTRRGAAHTRARPPTHTHARNHARTRAQPRTHTRAPPARTQHRPRQHASATSAHEPHSRATTRTRASYCARPPSGLRLFMFQQSSGR